MIDFFLPNDFDFFRCIDWLSIFVLFLQISGKLIRFCSFDLTRSFCIVQQKMIPLRFAHAPPPLPSNEN